MTSSETFAVAIDLGSTFIKAGRLTSPTSLEGIVAVPAPPLSGKHGIRQGDPLEYAAVAERLLRGVLEELPQDVPLGISSQRSTFLLWDAEAGRPATPLISWQDRRAADWCERHRGHERRVVELTGLMLSAHYAGPKLATLLASEPELRDGMRRGKLLFGNLESWLIWRATSGKTHRTDPSMAARTSMFDIERLDWSDELLQLFGVPRDGLPEVSATAGRATPLDGGAVLVASVADQASGALAVLDPAASHALVTLGTGGFVLRPVAGTATRQRGYLTAPCLASERKVERTVLEGTINGAGATLDRFPGPTRLPETDPSPEAYCLPDVSGLGSPHWRPDLALTFSSAANTLDPGGRRRVAVEGLLFRLREILDDLYPEDPPGRVLVAGGVARDPQVARGLASLLGRPVEVLDERQASLLGAARLAAGLSPYAAPSTTPVADGSVGGYLADKYAGWRRWVDSLL